MSRDSRVLLNVAACWYCVMVTLMSFKNECSAARDALRPATRPILGATALLFSGEILELISDSNLSRGTLQEPFDVASHIGNFREGAMFTAAAFAMIGIVRLTEPLADRARDVFRRRTKQVALGAFAVSSAIQVIGEKFALSNYAAPDVVNTSDPLDAAYGIVWSAETAYTA